MSGYLACFTFGLSNVGRNETKRRELRKILDVALLAIKNRYFFVQLQNAHCAKSGGRVRRRSEYRPIHDNREARPIGTIYGTGL